MELSDVEDVTPECQQQAEAEALLNKIRRQVIGGMYVCIGGMISRIGGMNSFLILGPPAQQNVGQVHQDRQQDLCRVQRGHQDCANQKAEREADGGNGF